MAQTLTLPQEGAPGPVAEGSSPRRWTREEYHRMAEVGILSEDATTELIDGQIYLKMPHGNAHITAIRRASRALRAIFNAGYDVTAQGPLPLGKHNEPQPDILVLRGEAEAYDGRDPDPESDVIIAIEVSDSTLRAGRQAKVPLYATFGIPEYWIVDLRHRTLEVRRRPFADGYAETLVLTEDQSVAVGGGTIRVVDVLPKAPGVE